FQMDSADFWQQARVPFALHAATAMQQQLPLTHPQLNTSGNQQQKHLCNPATTSTTTATTTNTNNHLSLNNKVQAAQLQQQQHQPQQQHNQQQQQQHQQQQHQLQHQAEQQCYGSEATNFAAQQDVVTTTTTSNHHLLFNAAAAAAAAAHLKSTALNNHNQNNSSSSSSNIIDSHLHISNLPVKLKQEHGHGHGHGQLQSDPRQTQAETETYSGSGFFGAAHMVEQQSHIQQQQEQLHQHKLQQQDRSTPPLTNANKAMSQGQQSPQHSITPSGSCSTPDIKYNNEKLANEIQLQLSRSSSAAAISERTLEECWSTLQRLFMHKSAMQQIQQQIPRVGLGAQGVAPSTAANMGSNSAASGLGTETKPHQCQQCMKSFSSNHQLVQHIRVHTGEKPYKCSYCDRRFKQLSHVQQHTRLHTGERPYKCHLPDCGRAFIQLSNLQQHLRNHDAQVERAKNRPFHCNICGKGFATESSLRTHTSKELQLHLGVLQQHAALIGGPNATSCPICHKLFLGTEALMDHMKHVHKEKTPPPLEPSGQFNEGPHGNNGNVGVVPNTLTVQCPSELNCGQPSTTSQHESYLGKRRTANHPCPVCGKHYVNEGSLRKHLACHAETAQLTSSLRMWPCSVCQAVFTNENGLLTHMDHMRMDPKHQFAAQYVLSRAAAEQRERESLLAASMTSSSGIRDTASILPSSGIGLSGAGGSNSLCPSPSANSECSSNGRLSSSSTSDQEQDGDQGLSESENNSHNKNMANVNNNNNSMNNNNNNSNNNNNCNSSKISLNLNDLRLPSSGQFSMEHAEQLHANRMSLMAAASAAAAAVAASSHGSRSQDDSIEAVVTANSGSAVVQAAVVNLAAAMRMNNSVNPHQQQHADHQLHLQQQSHTQQQHQHTSHLHHQQQQNQHQIPHLPQLLSPLGGHQQTHTGSTNNSTSNNSRLSPTINVPSLQMQADTTSSVMMNMMRSSLDSGSLGGMHQIEPLHHHQLQVTNYAPTSSHQGPLHHHPQHHQQHNHSQNPETALRMHQQAEAILRSHTEAAFRLAAASVAVTNTASSTAPNSNSSEVSIVVKNETSSHQQHQVNGDLQSPSVN
ncbi:hypothetical protein KR044_012141, partial [Drosophila immigrans]